MGFLLKVLVGREDDCEKPGRSLSQTDPEYYDLAVVLDGKSSYCRPGNSGKKPILTGNLAVYDGQCHSEADPHYLSHSRFADDHTMIASLFEMLSSYDWWQIGIYESGNGAFGEGEMPLAHICATGRKYVFTMPGEMIERLRQYFSTAGILRITAGNGGMVVETAYPQLFAEGLLYFLKAIENLNKSP